MRTPNKSPWVAVACLASKSALLLAAAAATDQELSMVDPPPPPPPLGADSGHRTHRHHHHHHHRYPPVVFVFENPTNGSTVDGDTLLHLSHTLRTARGAAGRLLTGGEVQALQEEDGVTMCFAIERPFRDPPVCAPLSTEAIFALERPLPGTWTTITANLHASTNTMVTHDDDDNADSEAAIFRSQEDTARGSYWESAGDSVSVFVALKGLSSAAVAAAAAPPPAVTMCGESICLDSSDMRSAYFDRVYRNQLWGEVRSGPGSTVHATGGVRSALEKVLQSYGVTSMLDAPCGDLTWMPLVRGIENVLYTGADISPKVVQENQRKFPSGSGIGERSGGGGGGGGDDGKEAGTIGEGGERVAERAGGFQGGVFVQADLVEGVPPSVDGKPYDLVFLRDLMLHLPPEQNLKVLQNVETSGAKLLMASTYLEGDENWSSSTFVPANGHPINLSAPPYCLRPPVALYMDVTRDRPDQRMGLWFLDPARPLASSGDCGQVAWG